MSDKQRVTFGNYLKELRLNETLGLRKFAGLINMRPSTYSNIERSIVLPPQDEKVLEEMALTLGICPDSVEGVKLYELAKQDNDNPPELSRARGIPVLARDIHGKLISGEKLRDLTRYLQNHFDNLEQVPYSAVA